MIKKITSVFICILLTASFCVNFVNATELNASNRTSYNKVYSPRHKSKREGSNSFNFFKSILCDHEYCIVNSRKATYFREGYTGDKVCTKCDEVTEGEPIEKLSPSKKIFKLKKGTNCFTIKYQKFKSAIGFKVEYFDPYSYTTQIKTIYTTKSIKKKIKNVKPGRYKVHISLINKKHETTDWTGYREVTVKGKKKPKSKAIKENATAKYNTND